MHFDGVASRLTCYFWPRASVDKTLSGGEVSSAAEMVAPSPPQTETTEVNARAAAGPAPVTHLDK